MEPEAKGFSRKPLPVKRSAFFLTMRRRSVNRALAAPLRHCPDAVFIGCSFLGHDDSVLIQRIEAPDLARAGGLSAGISVRNF